ncbi:MAG TPA: phosphatase PAP2 family protein [Crocinitomix sp.]|nr:phosphatase PAP2 family protein [Crocinitomix sp.]
MKKLIHKLTPFISIQFVFILLITLVLFRFNKNEAHVWVNQYQYAFLNYLFYILTYSVEFWGCLAIYIIIAVFKSYKYALIGLITYAVSGLITQLLKRNVFTEYKRPTFNIENLNLLPSYFNYETHHYFSFPSGHATAAFSLFVFLTLISKQRTWGFFYGFLACLTAFSRVYLSQHYFIDVLFGSLIGTITTIILFQYLIKVKLGKSESKLS